jgi:hypothetical protein
MTLTPVTKMDAFRPAPGFNAKAAQAAYDLVMKMDDEEAFMFTQIVTADVLEETIEKNLRVLQGRVNQIAKNRIEKVKKAAIRAAAVNVDESAVEFAKALLQGHSVRLRLPVQGI